MRFFFDRNTALAWPRILRELHLEHEFVHQDEDLRFQKTDVDTLIVTTIARDHPKPVFISADVNMYTRHPDERKALAASGMTCVFFKKGCNNQNIHVQAAKIITLWPELIAVVSRVRVPMTFEVSARMQKLDEYCPTNVLDK